MKTLLATLALCTLATGAQAETDDWFKIGYRDGGASTVCDYTGSDLIKAQRIWNSPEMSDEGENTPPEIAKHLKQYDAGRAAFFVDLNKHGYKLACRHAAAMLWGGHRDLKQLARKCALNPDQEQCDE